MTGHTPSQQTSADVREALVLFLDAMDTHGNWDDGCFYYAGRSASELQRPIELARTALSQSPATDAAGGNDEHPDCASQREHELYFALTLLASAVMARRSEWANWIQGGNRVAPIVRKALRLEVPHG